MAKVIALPFIICLDFKAQFGTKEYCNGSG